jgi:hypothetical protein
VYGFKINFSLSSQDSLNSHVPVITTVELYKHFIYKEDIIKVGQGRYAGNPLYYFGVISLNQHSIFYIGTGEKKMLAM